MIVTLWLPVGILLSAQAMGTVMNEPSSKAKTTTNFVAPTPRYLLRFISGKYQGGEYAVVPGKDVFVGRGSELEIVLVEDMVSRKHARFFSEDTGIFVEDLNSTNGTFVNGEKVKRAQIHEGDRVLIGTSILKLVLSDGAAAASMPVPPALPSKTSTDEALRPSLPGPRAGATRTMTGSIEEIPLPDLLQLLGTSRKSGCLHVRATGEDYGQIYLRKGTIVFASLHGATDLPPMKALFRILTWEKGLFDLDTGDIPGFETREIDLDVQEALMEGMRQLDEFNEVKGGLPPMSDRLELALPPPVKLRELPAELLDIVELVLAPCAVVSIFNRSILADSDTAKNLIKLIDKGVVRRQG